MTTYSLKDDVWTLLVHLGYLLYDGQSESVIIFNKGVSKEYINAIEDVHWNNFVHVVREPKKLHEALWREDAKSVAVGVDTVHISRPILQYNDENVLNYTIGLAFYSVKELLYSRQRTSGWNGICGCLFYSKTKPCRQTCGNY